MGPKAKPMTPRPASVPDGISPPRPRQDTWRKQACLGHTLSSTLTSKNQLGSGYSQAEGDWNQPAPSVTEVSGRTPRILAQTHLALDTPRPACGLVPWVQAAAQAWPSPPARTWREYTVS